MRQWQRKCVYSESDRIYHRELIWRNAYELFKKREGMTPENIIKEQRQYINSFNFVGRNKYKSVDCLRQYLYADDDVKGIAEQTFLNTMARKIPFFREI